MAVARSVTSTFGLEGYVSGIRVLNAAGVNEIRGQFDALEAEEGIERCQIGLLDRHFDRRFVWDLATNTVILDALEEVMGPDIMLLATHFFCKYPAAASDGSGEATDGAERQDVSTPERFVAWHQDVTYWGLEPPESVTAWYAVDDSDVENGCMRVIPGSHLGGIRDHGKSERAGNLLSINQEVPVSAAEEARAVDLVLKAGEISLHHGMAIHGSNPNRSTRRRCGLTLRYIAPKVRQVALNSQARGYQAILVRGANRFHHYGDLSAPFPR